ncbi:hypothetical protein ASF58_24475 [Methylobacterium sp. Leaf125]|uniref:hypothetical protein n=1 Tax=Methylobacterium sp. Leaf125 TaxID=1736265 RepID=UPI0006FC5A6E|nr:hypothetical protein [Methylobacterium sp. Leaf125]KQQ30775.1 hypothetical protein ASF58_24475 [Methylobacterium sp. Leaf125]
MSVLGKWRIFELRGYEDDYADMVEPAYILFENGCGEFAFGCVTGAFAGGAGRQGERATVAFDWNGNDEGDAICGSGSAEVQADGSLRGEIRVHGGNEIPFIARRWRTSSTLC